MGNSASDRIDILVGKIVSEGLFLGPTGKFFVISFVTFDVLDMKSILSPFVYIPLTFTRSFPLHATNASLPGNNFF